MSLRLSLLATALGAACALTACDNPPPDTHPDQPVTKRKLVFKAMTRTLEPMGLVARERQTYKPEDFLANATELVRLASQPWAHFPPDSNYPPSRALPAVWDKAAEFKQAQQDFQAATRQLLKAGEARDMAQIQQAVNTVQDHCKSCHDQFRRH
jgi:cytochrome c556